MPSEKDTGLKKLSALINQIKNHRILFGVLAAVMVTIVIFFALGGPRKASGNYLTETVAMGAVKNTVSASGMVEPVNTVSLSFKNSEVVKGIYVKVGDRVQPGQLLAELESGNLEAGVRQAEANLKNMISRLDLLLNDPTPEDLEKAQADVAMAQVTYNLAQTALERNKQLYEADALSKVEFEQAEADYINADAKLKQVLASLKALQAGSRPEDIASAESQVENSRAQLQMAQDDLAGVRMFSPIEGTVSAISGAEGQRSTATNNNTSGSGFIDVISEALQVKAQVNEGDIGMVRVGQAVEFLVNSFPDRIFKGEVSSVSPMAYTESNVQIYDIVVQLSEDYGELKAGMPANVSIIIEQQDNVLTVPKGAVTYGAVNNMSRNNPEGVRRQTPAGETQTLRQGAPGENQARGNDGNPGGTGTNRRGEESTGEQGKGQPAVVMILDRSGKPEPRNVLLGLSDLTKYAVLDGLNEGENVIVGSLGQTSPSNTAPGNQPMGQTFIMPGGGRR